MPSNARRVLPIFLASALLGSTQGSRAVAAQEPDEPDTPAVSERCSAPEFREFDFWLGRWEVRNADGDVIGHNEIRRISAGCGLLENWEGRGGGTGMSINTFDADLGRWTQRWVGSGASLWLEGRLEGPADQRRMVLSGTAPRSTPEGNVMDRISWTPEADGRVVQLWEISADGGETWQALFRGLYVRQEGDGGG